MSYCLGIAAIAVHGIFGGFPVGKVDLIGMPAMGTGFSMKKNGPRGCSAPTARKAGFGRDHSKTGQGTVGTAGIDFL